VLLPVDLPGGIGMLRRRLPTVRPWAAIIHDRRLQRSVLRALGIETREILSRHCAILSG